MIKTINVLLENKEIIQKDPLIYGMGVHNFTSCSCFDFNGKDWYSTETGFVHNPEPEYTVNYSERIRLDTLQLEVTENRTGRDN